MSSPSQVRPLGVMHGSRPPSKLRLPHRWPGVSRFCTTQGRVSVRAGTPLKPLLPTGPRGQTAHLSPAHLGEEQVHVGQVLVGHVPAPTPIPRHGPSRSPGTHTQAPTQAGCPQKLGCTQACGPGCTHVLPVTLLAPQTLFQGPGADRGRVTGRSGQDRPDSTPNSVLFKACPLSPVYWG